MTAIRRAMVDDAPDVARVHCQSHLEAYRPTFGDAYHGPSVAQRTAHWRERLTAGDVMFVALEDNAVIGFTHATLEDGEARVTTLYLLAAHHHRGIGRDLLRKILGHLAGLGHTEASFDCLALNAKAVAFYEAQGAREVARIINTDSQLHEEIRFVIPTLDQSSS